VRATTMYFGAALHTPRGGQCPSLLRPKEGAGGREDCREQGEEKGAEGGNAHHGRAGREGTREGKSEAGRGREQELVERGGGVQQGGGHTQARSGKK